VRLHSISSSNLDGSKVSVLSISEKYLNHPWAVTILEDFIYWSDRSQHQSQIYKANKKTGESVQLLETVQMQDKPVMIKVFHATAQPQQENLCHNAQCSHFCTVTTDLKTRCMCPDDAKTCQSTSHNSTMTLDEKDDSQSSTLTLSIIGGSSAAVFIILLIAVVLLYLYKRKSLEQTTADIELEKQNSENQEEAETMLTDHAESSV